MNGQTEDKKKQKTRVKVAIRVRPMIPKEIANNQNLCVDFRSNSEIILGSDKSYKFDHVFRDTSHQSQVYDNCVKDLVMSCFEGYNAAILAYGQTGSGKTYTMGTATHTLGNQNQTGIVPRVINEIFSVIEQKKNKIQFRVKASFLEIYNQEIKDLLASDHGMKNVKHKDTGISIREEKDGSVSIYGLTEEESTSAEQMVGLLERGGCNRTTAATLMNDASSRSHAIFTIFIEQHIIEDLYKTEKSSEAQNTEGYMTAKFFFVDLAGSQRAKKTGATGATLKQGININLGLLQLGNVISALSTIQKKQDQFITYRNSKLTRILQDCLGGNSNTYMIACVSPAESNFQESLNTLKYASKAMNIKNKPVVNRDPQSALISQLKQKMFELQAENRKLKQIMSKGGSQLSGIAENVDFNGFSFGDDEVEQELNEMKKQISSLQKKCETLQTENQQFRKKTNELQIRNYDLRRKNDRYQLLIEEVQNENPELNIRKKFQTEEESDEDNQNQTKDSGKSLLEKYQQQIQSLQADLQDKDKLFKQLEKELQKMEKNSKNDEQILIKKNKQIYQLSKEISNLQKLMNELPSKATSFSESPLIIQSTIQRSEQQSTQQITFTPSEQNTQQLQEQFLQHDKQLLTHQQSLQKIEQEASSQLLEIQKYIKEKEAYLEQMTKKQINMEYQLISEMKEQYHHKISMLEKQKKLLLKQKDETLGNNEKNKFVSKIDNLENQLKDYRKKVKEQKNIEKQLSFQSSQIKQLADEIKKSKLQKLQLNRKLKEDKDNFNKLKNQRIKELLLAKKENLKKQNALRKAQLENQKKTIQFKKKDEEVKRVKRVNQTLKTLLKQPVQSQLKVSSVLQRKEPHKKSVTIPSSAQMIKSSSQVHQNNELLSESQSNELIRSILTKMTTEIDHESTQNKYTQKGKSLEQELEILLNDEATFKLKYEKISLVGKEERSEEETTMMSELEINLADIHERVINLEDSINFIREKQLQIVNQHLNYFDPQNQVIYNRQLTEVIENVRIFYKSIFWAIRNLLADNFVLIETREQNESEINQLNQQIQELRENIIKLNHEHQSNLAKLREEMILRSYNNSYASGLQGEEFAPGTVSKKLEQKEKKSFERKILDLTKSNRQLSQQVEMWKRKCSVVQDKYQNMRNLMSKDKNIGRQPLNQKEESKEKKLAKNQSILDDVNDMLAEFDKMKKVSSVIEDTDKEKVEHIQDTLDYSINKWQCLGKIDAHNSAILSMTAHANILISTGTKSLKIWDLETSKIISDLSGPHLGGFVKYVMVDPDRRLMFTACEKNITIWDLVTLNIEGTLKGHKDEVRTMHINNDLLFTGGKGLANSGSLLVWDLRNLNPNHPMEDKERNQDIFSFASKNNILYYGTRNHHVRRMNMTNMEILSPFEPPHMDSVTGLAIVKDKLISGSKDKNLLLWSLDHSINNSKHTFPAFNDYITLCESDKELPIFYSGSRDGQIKVGGIKNDKIELIGGIMAHTQSVNAICPLQENQNIIVTASADKTIKLWKPTHETVEAIQGQFI